MKRKTAAQILREADADLNIIPAGVKRRGRRKRAIRLDEVSKVEMPVYVPRRMTEKDWEAAGGLKCPRCHQEVVRLIPIGLTGKIKICPGCIERRRRLIEHKRHLIDLRRGAELARLKRLRLIT